MLTEGATRCDNFDHITCEERALCGGRRHAEGGDMQVEGAMRREETLWRQEAS